MEVSRNRIKGIAINRKRVLEGAFFLLVMVLSFYTIFHGQDMEQIRHALGRLSPLSLCAAMAVALFFVSAEGIMIYYLLRSLNGRSSLGRCICYSFIGFFYSGITPSATGGQPMQLYYMSRDDNRLSESSVVLMTVALIYKLVLVLIGIAALVFWQKPLSGGIFSALFAGAGTEYAAGSHSAGGDAGAGDHEKNYFRNRRTACAHEDFAGVRDKTGEDSAVYRRLPGGGAFSAGA